MLLERGKLVQRVLLDQSQRGQVAGTDTLDEQPQIVSLGSELGIGTLIGQLEAIEAFSLLLLLFSDNLIEIGLDNCIDEPVQALGTFPGKRDVHDFRLVWKRDVQIRFEPVDGIGQFPQHRNLWQIPRVSQGPREYKSAFHPLTLRPLVEIKRIRIRLAGSFEEQRVFGGRQSQNGGSRIGLGLEEPDGTGCDDRQRHRRHDRNQPAPTQCVKITRQIATLGHVVRGGVRRSPLWSWRSEQNRGWKHFCI